MFFPMPSLSNRSSLIIFTPLLLMAAALFCSCTSTPRTKIRLNQSALQKINSLGVLVKQDQDFSVLIGRQRPSSVTGGGGGCDPVSAVLGLIAVSAAVAEEIGRASDDRNMEQKLRPVVDQYDVKKVMRDKLTQYLRAADLFKRVDSTDTENRRELQKEGFDGVLKVTLEQWGLGLCERGSSTSHIVQLGFNLHEKLVLQDGTVVWEREELYLDSDCRPWQEIEAEPKLLEQVLTRSTDDLAGRMVNEIRFPRRAQKGASL
jgi:hypothetical protein